MKLWVVYTPEQTGNFGHKYFVDEQNAKEYGRKMAVQDRWTCYELDCIETED